ncbi:MAG TPA: hypothetical protein VEY49_10515, partial [Solirubrobacteraceae bacterium]|nr:hypothetical protein [Solirubrobacteraceae bacterium]
MRVQLRVALLVALEGATGAVVAPAVELDDQSVLRPVRVDLEAVELRVRDRERQAVAGAEVEECCLEVAAGGLCLVLGELSDVLRTRPAGAGGQQRGDVEQVVVFGGLQGARQLAAADAAGEIRQGAGGGGNRDAVLGGDVVGREVEHAVHPDALALAASPANDRDVDPPAGRGPEVEQRSRVSVAQHRAGPDRSHGGEPPAAVRQPAVPDGIHPPVKGDQ